VTAKSDRRAARQTVAAYHEEQLGELIDHVKLALERFEGRALDAFEVDELIFSTPERRRNSGSSATLGTLRLPRGSFGMNRPATGGIAARAEDGDAADRLREQASREPSGHPALQDWARSSKCVLPPPEGQPDRTHRGISGSSRLSRSEPLPRPARRGRDVGLSAVFGENEFGNIEERPCLVAARATLRGRAGCDATRVAGAHRSLRSRSRRGSP
jgi:hypothetical protein